ncbi:HET-domain-containing protein [Xylariaceae sp. AK1471]|nr:HET-domain-containing protein [Xylariaceae sp. AK1471]
MEWHDRFCPRLDLISCDAFDSCLRCGSYSEPATAYSFPPISKQSDTRLVYLFPGGFEQDIRCEISVHDLSSRPEYEAVSYTWADETGNDDLCRTIFVSGKPLSVTRNCENALKRIRRSDSVRAVWIDAVCINQNDKNERGHQVQLMPRIYSYAQRVLIYIGEGTDDSDFCLNALGSGRTNSFEDQSFKIYISLKCLLSRQYFSRVWVLQEIALARTATVICGDRHIMWTQLYNTNLEVRHAQEIQSLVSRSILKMKEAELYTTPDRLLDLLDISRRCKAKDPRDKVYALLGLIIDHHSQGLEADYNLSVKDLYIKVALDLALRHGWKNILLRAGTAHRSIDTLPSWVPDWSHHVENMSIPANAHPFDYGALQYKESDGSLNFRALYMGPADDLTVFLFKTAHLEDSQTDHGDTHVPQSFFLPDRIYVLLKNPILMKSKENFFFSLCRLHVSDGEIIGNQLTATIRDATGDQQGYYRVYAHDLAVSLTLTTVHDVLEVLSELEDDYLHEDEPWDDLISSWTRESSMNYSDFSSWPSRDILLHAIEHESRPPNEVDLLWRNIIELDPSRQEALRGHSIDYELLLDLNEAIWKLYVRLFLWRELEVKII